MSLEVRDSLDIITFARVHIHASAVALTEEVKCLPVCTHHGIAVLAGLICNIGVLTALGIIEPYIARNRRGMVLSPLVLATLTVLIVEALAVRCKTEHLYWCSQHLERTSALHWHLVQLRQSA